MVVQSKKITEAVLSDFLPKLQKGSLIILTGVQLPWISPEFLEANGFKLHNCMIEGQAFLIAEFVMDTTLQHPTH